jgi:hypothetical protein
MKIENYDIYSKSNHLKKNNVVTYTSDGKPLSYRYDEHWDFTGTKEYGINVKPVISFINIPIKCKRDIQKTLHTLYDFYKHNPKYSTPSYSMLDAYKFGLSNIYSLTGSVIWEDLSSDVVFNRFKRKLAASNFSPYQIESQIINVLNRLCEIGIIKKEIDGRELMQSIVSSKQHLAIPTNMYKKILDNALSVVEKYHPLRKKICLTLTEINKVRDSCRENRRARKSQKKEFEVKYKKKIESSIPSFEIDFTGKQASEIVISCLIVVLAFSGVRKGEAVSFNSKSAKPYLISGNEVWVLTGEDTKPNQGVSKAASWQSHEVAKHALELADAISRSIRKFNTRLIEDRYKTGKFNVDEYKQAIRNNTSAFLSHNMDINKVSFIINSFNQRIQDLVKKWGVTASGADVDEFNKLNDTRIGELSLGGFLPKLSTHDFRRSFAVFFKRHGFGTLAGIKFQYKHKNINMSGYYANNADLMAMEDLLLDEQLLDMLEEEGIKLGVEIFDDIYNESVNLSGVAGERIALDKFKKLKTDHKIFMPRDDIELLIRRGELSAVRLPSGGYCTSSSCERVCSMFSAENAKCQFKVYTDKEAKKLKRKHTRFCEQFESLNNGEALNNSLLYSIKQNIKLIETVLCKHNVQFIEFTSKIKATNNGE